MGACEGAAGWVLGGSVCVSGENSLGCDSVALVRLGWGAQSKSVHSLERPCPSL